MKKILKRAGFAVAGLVAVGLISFKVAEGKANSRLSQKFTTHRLELALPDGNDAQAIARGKHLMSARYGCTACHGQTLGGGTMIDDPPIGKILGPNITQGQGSRTQGYTMADWDRVVRHGVRPDGSAAIMPSEDYFKMSDAELSDIAAYARSVPPVHTEVPRPEFGPIGKLLVAFGKFPIAAERQPSGNAHPKEAPATENSAQFGEHLAAVCTGCHRANLAGGPMTFGPPSWPAAPNLTPHANGTTGWSYQDFERALTQGVAKDGHQLKEPMAGVVVGTKAMLPTERQALWTYLQSLPPTPTNQ